jgi:hypothetical protein
MLLLKVKASKLLLKANKPQLLKVNRPRLKLKVNK